jgi:hypothetical protein
MRKSIILTVFFALAIQMPHTTAAYESVLIPPSIVDTPSFAQLFEAIRVGKIIYRMDVFEKFPNAKLKDTLTALCSGKDGLVFDTARIDFCKKGFTRYYLFSAGGQSLVMRICLTSELILQPEIPKESVIVEGTIADLKATYQVFDMKAILGSDKMRPRPAFNPRDTGRSS